MRPFRRSELWRKTFEDENGKSKILRSGKFGIGALATFLLGNEFYLSTRYVEDELGIGVKFFAQLKSEFIEIKKINRPIGTTIRIQINENTREKLSRASERGDKYLSEWDWYCLEEPIVVRKLEKDLFRTTATFTWPFSKHPYYMEKNSA